MYFFHILYAFLLYSSLLYSSLVFSYLDKKQWNTIDTILANKNLSPQNKHQINRIIYTHHYFWAKKQARIFKQFHYYKCKTIREEEINLYALIGLWKASQKYNPTKYTNTSFIIYAKKYVIGELYRGMTDLQTLNIIPRNERKKSIYNQNIQNIQNNENNQNNKRYKNIISTVGEDEFLIDEYVNKNINEYFCTNSYNNEKYYEMLWEQIYASDCSQFTKNIIRYKFSFDFKKKMSNKKVATLLSSSEEHVRKQLHSFFNTFLINI
jgi:DNA-directed RNA polymerase specialized sigma subunit